MAMASRELVNGEPGTHIVPGTDSDGDEGFLLPRAVQLSYAAADRAQQQREVSAMLGEKMLQGWTLLGDQCPM